MSAFCHCFTNVSHATSQRKITVGMIMKLEMLAEGTHCYHTQSEVDSKNLTEMKLLKIPNVANEIPY